MINYINRNLIFVEGGAFTMGNSYGFGYFESDLPPYDVKVSSFYINKYLVTFEEYDEYCEQLKKEKSNDEKWGRGKRPVINVSWNEVILFCNWLSEKSGLPLAYAFTKDVEKKYEYSEEYDEIFHKYMYKYFTPYDFEAIKNNDYIESYFGSSYYGCLLDENERITLDTTKVKGYRLATDAEWEFASKGGNLSKNYVYSGSNKPDEVAVYYNDFFSRKTEPVGTKSPNEMGLFDMSGNVSEYVQDWDYDYRDRIKYGYPVNPLNNIQHPDNYLDSLTRICRSGNILSHIHNSYRDGIAPMDKYNNVGFRIARSA